MIYILALISVSLTAGAQISLRKTMVGAGALPAAPTEWMDFALSVLSNPWFGAGLACYGVSIGLWLIVLSKMEVSVAYPLSSIGFVITAFVGFFFLGENVTLLRIVGIALICGGLLVITRPM